VASRLSFPGFPGHPANGPSIRAEEAKKQSEEHPPELTTTTSRQLSRTRGAASSNGRTSTSDTKTSTARWILLDARLSAPKRSSARVMALMQISERLRSEMRSPIPRNAKQTMFEHVKGHRVRWPHGRDEHAQNGLGFAHRVLQTGSRAWRAAAASAAGSPPTPNRAR
jgi:hypothetical protein